LATIAYLAGQPPCPNFNDIELTAAVIRSFEETPDPRVKFLMEELVKSLHDFVRKTDLTFDEWGYAIDFLTRVGQKCSSTRQEFILLSDVLGVSMLVDAVNHRQRDGATETTGARPVLCRRTQADAARRRYLRQSGGRNDVVQSRVTDLKANRLRACRPDVWHADNDGLLRFAKAVPTRPRDHRRGRVLSRRGWTVSSSGPSCRAVIRSRPMARWRDDPADPAPPDAPRPCAFPGQCAGYEPLITHVFIDGDKYLDTDVVFGVKNELIAQGRENAPIPRRPGRQARGRCRGI